MVNRSTVMRFDQFVDVADNNAPGPPMPVMITRKSGGVFGITWALPSKDSDGTELTGLTKITEVAVFQIDGVDPTVGMGPDEILAHAASDTRCAVVVAPITPAHAGANVEVDIKPVRIGPYVICAWVEDGP